MICVIAEKRTDGKSSFRDAVEYSIYGKKSQRVDPVERVLYSGCRNLESSQFDLDGNFSLRDIFEEMESTARRNKLSSDPVVHAILSFREGEIPTETQCQQAVEIWAKEQGLEFCQLFWACHQDTDNLHIDIVSNRIDPVNFKPAPMRLSYKANERAARMIEIEQGWRIEMSGKFYKVNQLEDGNFEIVEKKKARERSISKKARDHENRTGLQSGETIAKNVAAPILFDSVSWEDVHKKLAEVGIKLEKAGSGGVLWIGGQPVKLSVAGRQCTFKNLVKRFGEYVPRDPDIDVKEFSPQPLEKGGFWYSSISEHVRQKREFDAEKKKAKKELDKEIYQMRCEFYKSKKTRREALKAERSSWKGHGQELNARRSLLAGQFAIEEALMRKLIAEKRKKFREFWRSFWNYEDWLRQQENDRAAEIWRYRKSWNDAVIFGEFYIFNPHTDLSSFRVDVVDGGSVEYYDRETNKLAILDRGRRIEVSAWRDDEALTLALLIAAEKWPRGINIEGNGEFLNRCVEICARENVKLKDPELQTLVEERHALEREQYVERDLGR